MARSSEKQHWDDFWASSPALDDVYANDGRVVALLPEYQGPRGDIWAVYPSRRHLSAKVRLFVDHVAHHFQAPQGGA